jgi:hypothetical protein
VTRTHVQVQHHPLAAHARPANQQVLEKKWMVPHKVLPCHYWVCNYVSCLLLLLLLLGIGSLAQCHVCHAMVERPNAVRQRPYAEQAPGEAKE